MQTSPLEIVDQRVRATHDEVNKKRASLQSIDRAIAAGPKGSSSWGSASREKELALLETAMQTSFDIVLLFVQLEVDLKGLKQEQEPIYQETVAHADRAEKEYDARMGRMLDVKLRNTKCRVKKTGVQTVLWLIVLGYLYFGDPLGDVARALETPKSSGASLETHD